MIYNLNDHISSQQIQTQGRIRLSQRHLNFLGLGPGDFVLISTEEDVTGLKSLKIKPARVVERT